MNSKHGLAHCGYLNCHGNKCGGLNIPFVGWLIGGLLNAAAWSLTEAIPSLIEFSYGAISGAVTSIYRGWAGVYGFIKTALISRRERAFAIEQKRLDEFNKAKAEIESEDFRSMQGSHTISLDDIVDLKEKEPRWIDIREWIASPQYQGAADKFGFVHNGVNYLVKRDDSTHPEERRVYNELVCNQIAAILGVPVPRNGIYTDDGKPCFAQEIFTTKKSELTHIHRFKEGRPLSVAVIRDIIKNKSIYPERDEETFMKTLLFDCVIGNGDRHGRNLGFLQYKNLLRLSPIYDNVSTVLPKHNNMFAQSFAGRIECSDSQLPTVAHYIKEIFMAHNQGALKWFKSVRDSEKAIRNTVNQSLLRQDQKDALIKQLQTVLEEISNYEAD